MKPLFRYFSAAILCLVLFIPTAVPALAKSGQTENDHWTGIVGKPKSLGPAAITHVEMSFQVPRLVCGSGASDVVIWVGMDAAGLSSPKTPRPDLRLTQAGLLGDCTSGVPSWAEFYEAYPAVPMLLMPGSIDLHPGDGIWLKLDYRPDIAAGAFVTEMLIFRPNVPTVVLTKTFFSPSGAKQRQRAECIVERPYAESPNPHFTDLAPFTNGVDPKQDFAATCIGGNGLIDEFPSGPASNSTFVQMVSQAPDRHPLATSAELSGGGGVVTFHWLAKR